jgi:hypothetical protein
MLVDPSAVTYILFGDDGQRHLPAAKLMSFPDTCPYCEGDGDTLGDTEGVPDGLGGTIEEDGDDDGDAALLGLAEAPREGEALGAGLLDLVGNGDGDVEGVGLRLGVGALDGVGFGKPECDGLGPLDGVCEGPGAARVARRWQR